jgi:predicted RNA-binding protein with TRAM domain
MSRRGHAVLAFNSVAGTLFRHSANAARRSHAAGAFLPCGGMRKHAHACASSSVVAKNGEPELATAATNTTTVVAASATKPLRRGDIVDVRVRALDYGGGGVAELADADEHDHTDANLRVHTPKGALPGDRVRVILTKVRRPRLSEATSEFPALGIAGVGAASVPLGPVPIAEAHFIERTERSPDAFFPLAPILEMPTSVGGAAVAVLQWIWPTPIKSRRSRDRLRNYSKTSKAVLYQLSTLS